MISVYLGLGSFLRLKKFNGHLDKTQNEHLGRRDDPLYYCQMRIFQESDYSDAFVFERASIYFHSQGVFYLL